MNNPTVLTKLLTIIGSSASSAISTVIVLLPTAVTVKNPVRFIIFLIPIISPTLIECALKNLSSTAVPSLFTSTNLSTVDTLYLNTVQVYESNVIQI